MTEAVVENAGKVTLTRDEVLPMMLWVGWKQAGKWDNARIASKLKGLPEVKPEDAPPDEAIKTALEAVLEALQDGAEIVITGDAEGAVSTGTNGEKPKRQKKEKPPKKPKREKGPVRGYLAGKIFAKYGFPNNITDEMVAELDGMYGRPNPPVSRIALTWATAIIRGYTETPESKAADDAQDAQEANETATEEPTATAAE